MGIKTKVKEATTMKNPHDPPPYVVKDFAAASRNFGAFQDIMVVVWKRLNSPGREWLHIQKGLYVLDGLLRYGSDQVVNETKVHIPEIRTLTDFYHDSATPDKGATIRERAHALMKLLNDEEELARVRAKCKEEMA